jgi:hypothetical protein
MEDREILVQFVLQEARVYTGSGKVAYAVTKDVMSQIKQDLGPSIWNDNDEIVMFNRYIDGSYTLEKRRSVYDWKLKQSKLLVYDVLDASEELVNKLTEVFTDLWDLCRVTYLQQTKDVVKNDLEQEFGMVTYNLKNLRKNILASTDWVLVSDSPYSIEEKNLYIKYRQELRDITIQPAWLAKEYLKIQFPISPTDYLKKYPNIEVEYLSTDDQWVNEALLRVKAKLLRFAGYLGFSDQAYGFDVSSINIDEPESFDKLKESVDHMLAKIDPKLEIIVSENGDYCPECE